ncbi:glycosyltransferase family 2 protein [Sulfitobacter aestuarii]|uniref:Glycosyltransferase family 2 protein n=1 Tax=Sulfitobacter aestuarii TaxID=2161676 RepID=A0ABW5U814_9RHOB
MLSPEDTLLLQRSGLFDADWYLDRYPDVLHCGTDPLRHYLRVGVTLLRDPGPRFSGRHYLLRYPDVAQAGLHPLLHYLHSGQAEGRLPYPMAVKPSRCTAAARLSHYRSLLETGGLSATPLAALEAAAENETDPGSAAGACEILAFWALYHNEFELALQWLTRLTARGGRDEIPGRLAPVYLVALEAVGKADQAWRLYQDLPESRDLHLAATRCAPTPGARLDCLNQALALAGAGPLRQIPGPGPLLDRLRGPDADPGRGSIGEEGPLVSVLMAAHNAADTILTALDGLCCQNWQNLEILVIDDASRDATAMRVRAAMRRDSRIRLIALERNRGAYAARNIGLQEAQGDFITLHDADDWSHPDRILVQMRFLLRERGFAGCMTQQTRVHEDLRVSRWSGSGNLVFENLSSLMLPRTLLQDCLGRWDEVRVSADSELLRRVRCLFGAQAVPLLDKGPLTLTRDHACNATVDDATGMGWFYYGARREYYEAQIAHHRRARSLCYSADRPRPFAIPKALDPTTAPAQMQRYDRIYVGLLQAMDPGTRTLLRWLDEDRVLGRRCGLVPLYTADLPPGGGLAIHPRLRERIDGAAVSVLCYGERADCVDFRRLPGQAIEETPRYLPQIWRNGERILM